MTAWIELMPEGTALSSLTPWSAWGAAGGVARVGMLFVQRRSGSVFMGLKVCYVLFWLKCKVQAQVVRLMRWRGCGHS